MEMEIKNGTVFDGIIKIEFFYQRRPIYCCCQNSDYFFSQNFVVFLCFCVFVFLSK
jgi:hypothetical protein